MRKRPRKILKYLFVYVPSVFLLVTAGWVLVLKWVPVYVTPLMLVRSFEYRSDPDFRTYKYWKPLEELSPNMARAVVAGEDNRFFEHGGFDWTEIGRALEEHERGRRLRGASTISQQTAKNVFLLPGRSWLRKGMEAYFTCLIEWIWGKRRILEVYLNVAEMGKGIYGTEAAAERLFHTRGGRLTLHQSALITACLPAPLRRRADAPTPYLLRRAAAIERNVRNLVYPEWLLSDIHFRKEPGGFRR